MAGALGQLYFMSGDHAAAAAAFNATTAKFPSYALALARYAGVPATRTMRLLRRFRFARRNSIRAAPTSSARVELPILPAVGFC